MGVCTSCGTIMHDDDAGDHTCDPADKPAVGKPNKPQASVIKSPDGSEWVIGVDNAGKVTATRKA